MRKYFSAAALTAILALGAGVSGAIASSEHDHSQHQHRSDADILLGQPSTWFKNAPQGGYTMKFNPAHPAGWAIFLNPKTHTAAHMAFANPATYAQFMTADFYAQFLNPNNWMAWFKPSNYATYLDPHTYAYWMTPHAYVHALNPKNYVQAVNGANYLPLVSAETLMSWFQLENYNVLGQPTGTVEGDAGGDYIGQVLSMLGLADATDTTPQTAVN